MSKEGLKVSKVSKVSKGICIMGMKKAIVLVLVFCFSVFAVFAVESLASVIPNASQGQLSKFLSGEMVETSTLGDGDMSNVSPTASVFEDAVANAKTATSGFSENLTVLLPYPKAWEGLSQEEIQVALLNLMRSVSTQEGITYISHRAGDKPKVLFDRSWYLSDPSDWNSKIDDPVVSELPSSIESYCYQKDSTFGGNIYKHDFTIDENEIFLSLNNVTALKFMGFTCVKEGQLHMYLDTYLTKEGILLNAMAKIVDRDPQVRVLFITVDLPSAFLRRVTALKEWMEARLLQVDAQ